MLSLKYLSELRMLLHWYRTVRRLKTKKCETQPNATIKKTDILGKA
jgi:hypothetical protein